MISTVLEQPTIIDGSGDPAYTTDLGIVGDRIALIGDLRERDAVERVDCRGLTLAPGFIDVHSHSDALWLELPRCDGKIAQGVTTEIAGNCGCSISPRAQEHSPWRDLDDFLTQVQRQGIALNVATLVGLGTTRRIVAGDSERALLPEEIEAQAALVRESCEQGALGVSSGLIYPPSSYAGIDELAAMASAAVSAGAPRYVSHVRDEAGGVVDAIAEAIEVGRRSGAAVQCSHHKVQDRRNWGTVHRTLGMIDAARRRGIDAACDVYPYTASWTDLATILPASARFGGVEATLERLADPPHAAAIALQLDLQHAGEWNAIMLTDLGSEKNAGFAGMRMDEVARRLGLSPSRAAVRLLLEERLDVGAIFFRMCEDDVASVLSASFCCIGSDASIRALDGPTARGVPHPRTFGCFPRVFGRFVRGRKTLDAVEAVRRMTSLPAAIFGLRERGSIAVGNYADLVAFDLQNIRDTATYEQPYAFPVGIEHVFVNGRTVLRSGRFTNALSGRVLRHGGS